jgi:predicted O-linked N-acetylglucosamine transferase (SPINDLY family)
MRQRIEQAVDRFVDVRNLRDIEVVSLAREMGLDIAVDLAGYTGGRTGLFALRLAPIQVSYLGYLGTLGARFMDYLIADETIVPASHKIHYTERIAYLPCYQANASNTSISDRQFSREELGLAPAGFVFCCFNASYKLTPQTFDRWTRILHRVKGSQLLLLSESAEVERNLKIEADRRGIDANRLVFGGKLPVPEYLARFRSADLFLDTLPYNAGTTASNALWAGLPVLTRIGESFAGRVAASLLNALELPELIAETDEQYESTAVALASDPTQLHAIQHRLRQKLKTTLLFNTPVFTQHLEESFRQMHRRWQAGLAPDDIYVSPGSCP